MSLHELEKSIEKLKTEMKEFSPYTRFSDPITGLSGLKPKTGVDKSIVLAVSHLLENYGTFIGKVKAKFPTRIDKLEKIDEKVSEVFNGLYKAENWRAYFSIINMGIQKISEAKAYVKRLESVASKDVVPKSQYDQAIEEVENQKRVIEILVKSRGLPLLNDLIEKSKASGLDIDENWAVTICAVNLIEAAVNKKLEDFGEPAEGEFNKKLDRVTKMIKEKEGRNIQKLIPHALMSVRNKLDHASHKYKPDSKETTMFVTQALSFLESLFPA